MTDEPPDSDILAALCRQYLDKRPVPSPASPDEMLDELRSSGYSIDLDGLRACLRSLYARYQVEEDRPDVMRAALVKRAYPDVVKPPGSTRTLLKRVRTLLKRARKREKLLAAAVIAVTAIVGLLWAIKPGPDETIIDPSEMGGAHGVVKYCTGKDVASNQHHLTVNAFNKRFAPGGLKMELVELAEDATQQYETFSRYQRQGLDNCDVLYSDVIWTADFVRNGWLLDLSRYNETLGRNRFVPPMVKAATIAGKTWGIPKQAQVGLLFYRKDHVREPPATWQALYEQASAGSKPRLRYQALAYEGLTVNFLEIALAAGARDIVTSDGKANIDEEPERQALRFMVDGIKHAAPAAVANQIEGANERAFERGRAYFMRNWPPYETVLRRDPDLTDRFATAPLPAWEEGGHGTVLGGHILVISSLTKNRGAALKAVDFLSSRAIVKRDATKLGLAPALTDLWRDADVERALPSFQALRDGVFNATLRPLVANYQGVSAAIYTNVNRALQGLTTPETALQAAEDQMQQALDAPPAG